MSRGYRGVMVTEYRPTARLTAVSWALIALGVVVLLVGWLALDEGAQTVTALIGWVAVAAGVACAAWAAYRRAASRDREHLRQP